MRLLIFEYACAQSAESALPESVRREGRAMFDAVMRDTRQLAPAVELVTVSNTQHAQISAQELFQRAASEADFALIIAPEFDGILEQHARWAIEAGCQLLGPLPHAIALTADKWQLYRHWLKLGVPTPKTWLPGELPTASVRYVKKHRWGAGSLGVGWWNPGCDVPVDHLVQEFVPGTAVSLALLISRSGQVLPLLPAEQHISCDGMFRYQGGSFLKDGEQGERLVQLAVQAIKEINGLQGYVGIDAVLGCSSSEDRVLEVNPRLTTSYLGLRQATSHNLLQCMLDQVGCDKVEPVLWSPC